ncbi:hypothetical protein H1R20_g545, partial [Candolleomyces eurysporus]
MRVITVFSTLSALFITMSSLVHGVAAVPISESQVSREAAEKDIKHNLIWEAEH